jgi:potassium-transporting ATPase potassium-binding subunit
MESLSGTGALTPLGLMMTGELAFGGIGSGLTSLLLVVLLTVFIAGPLVGRTARTRGPTASTSRTSSAGSPCSPAATSR